MMQRNIGSSNIPTKQHIPLGNVQPTVSLKFSNSGPIENLPKQKFVSAMKTLFDLMDDKKTGLVRLSDIEQRWQDDGAKGLPHGVIECLSKVTPLNGMLTFERFCAGLKICLLRNQSDSNKLRQSLTNTSDGNSLDKKLQRPPSAPLLDLENSVSGSPQWNSNNTAAVRPNNAIPVQRTLSLPKLCPEKDGDSTTPEPYIIPSLYAPPKPPRTALVMGNGVTNINNLDRFDKAEIRHALQNWQMGILMNEMDNKDKKYTVVSQLNRGTADGQPQNNLFQKKTNVRRREPRRHTLQNGIDYNLLKKLKQLEQEKTVLLEGLNAVDAAQEWYLKQISTVQDKIKHLGRMGSHVEQWSEAHQEKLDLQRARVMEVNRYLSGLAESWERGGFPMHMNLAVRHSGSHPSFHSEMISRMKQQNEILSEENSQKSDRINVLERERQSLIRELVKCQRSNVNLSDEIRKIIPIDTKPCNSSKINVMNSRYNEEVQKLFEFWCEIRPASAGEKVSGHIISSFPERFKDPEIINKIPDFAYPCSFINDSLQVYSFVLTSSDSKWRFGFCRHDPRTGTAMVLITYLPWHDTFIRFMNALGELKRTDNNEFQPFLSEAYNRGVPEPGSSLKLFYNAGTTNFMFQRPSQFQLPSIPENHNLNLYYNFVDARNMINVFAAMLAERRIVFTSHRFDRLSSCVQAANSFLYPMVWQHIFIPILPMKMREILCAPMPFLIGVPEAVLEKMTRDELGEVVVLNCDNKTFNSPFDDVKSMPHELVSQLKKQLNVPSELIIGDRISKIFLRILVQLIGGYRDAIKFTQGDKITWDRDLFIDSRASNLRPFLRNMMELQIFQQFIEERLDMLNTGLGFSDEFELETLRYSEGDRTRKHYKDFLKNVKDKTNPAYKSAMESVKQGSRGVKTAYKGIKSKLRDRTPPNSAHQYGNHSQSHDGGHHSNSAPNSPVFTKRPQTEYSYNQNHRKPNTILQTSNSLMNNSNFTNNNHINKSPTVSQPSSNSSSEMNILQELQQHALFKMPAVDRSLKPSIDYSTLRPLRSGSLLHTPTFQNKSDSYNSDALSIGALCLIDNNAAPSTAKHRKPVPSDDSLNSSSKSSSFDSPPEMPSPPVPPRVSNSNHAKTKLDLPVSMFENEFVNNDFFCINTSVAAPPIAPIRKNHIEQNKSNDITPNLINLDTSFELEDFDPLNQNAKPLPPPKTALVASSSQSLNRIPLPGLTNPMYPYYTPQNQLPLKKPQQHTNDDDVELLRKYGLDQFSLVDGGASGSSQSNGSMRNSSDRNNWTVFD